MTDITILGPDDVLSLADELGREIVNEKTAAPLPTGMLAKGVGKVMGAAIRTPGAVRTGVGAAVGAGAGALKHMMTPGQVNPQTGQVQKGSLVGSMVAGGVMGGMAGAGSRAVATRIGSMRGQVGSFARGALQAEGKAMHAAGQIAPGNRLVSASNAMQRTADRTAARAAAAKATPQAVVPQGRALPSAIPPPAPAPVQPVAGAKVGPGAAPQPTTPATNGQAPSAARKRELKSAANPRAQRPKGSKPKAQAPVQDNSAAKKLKQMRANPGDFAAAQQPKAQVVGAQPTGFAAVAPAAPQNPALAQKSGRIAQLWQQMRGGR